MEFYPFLQKTHFAQIIIENFMVIFVGAAIEFGENSIDGPDLVVLW